MKQVVILSGKGGTGKTTLTAAFSTLAGRVVVADCDVDAPNLHVLLHPEIMERLEFKGSKIAVIDETKCIRCGLCREKCKFDAVTENIEIDQFSCEGCGVCTIICPTSAISSIERVSGQVYISKIRFGFMVHAILNPGEANSGKLVTVVRQNAKAIAEKENITHLLIDGPPGIGCPVISSVTGSDLGLIVTEPTDSGIHDLKRALQLLEHFNIPPLVCVNMYDINRDNAEKILNFCGSKGVKVAGMIPFNPTVIEAMVKGKTILEYSPKSNVADEIRHIWKEISEMLSLKNKHVR